MKNKLSRKECVMGIKEFRRYKDGGSKSWSEFMASMHTAICNLFANGWSGVYSHLTKEDFETINYEATNCNVACIKELLK